MKQPDEAPPTPVRPMRRSLATLALGVALISLAIPVGNAGADTTPTGPTITASASVVDPAGGTVTVTGSGFDANGNLGVRPPFRGQPAGVYVVFGRFGNPWKPSEGAPSSARQVISQVWALPAASYQVLGGASNPELALMNPDGSFTVELAVQQAEGPGTYGIVTFPGSGAVNPAEELFLPVTFGAPPTTAPPTTTPPTTTPPTTTPPTTTPPTTTPPTTTPPSTGTGSRSASGTAGQNLTVTPANDLNPDGQRIRVVGENYDPSLGIYVALCVDQGPTSAPSPCVGGVDMEGTGSSSVWISSNPPSYAGDLATPFGPNGSFDVSLDIAAADEFVNCLDEATRCVVATRADHLATADRSGDVKVPVFFSGQTPTDEEPPVVTATVRVSADTVRAGEDLSIEGDGMLPGEQVQVWMLSDPILVSVIDADASGEISGTFTVPADLEPGQHRVEVRGLTSGRSAQSDPITVLAALDQAPPPVAVGGITQTAPPVVAGATTTAGTTPPAPAPLALTGGGTTLVLPGLALLAIGAVLLAGTRSTKRSGATR